MPEKSISELDPNMQLEVIKNPEALTWFEPRNAPVRLDGFYWMAEDNAYCRLPVSSFDDIAAETPNVNGIARATVGGQISFTTDSPVLALSVRLGLAHSMYHMTAVGQCGFDCYIAYPGEDYRFEGIVGFNRSASQYDGTLFKDRGREKKRVIINFPLYERVESVVFGIEKGSFIEPPAPRKSERPVVFYGTSITQGGCATRPGMAYTNILSRRFDLPFINLGFSGHAFAEPSLARAICKIKDPALIVFACEANAAKGLYNSLDPFIAQLRRVHTKTPILIISRIAFQPELHNPGLVAERDKLRAFQADTARRLNDDNIFFVDGSTLMGERPDECTVDCVHPTDLGFMHIADSLSPVLQRILGADFLS